MIGAMTAVTLRSALAAVLVLATAPLAAHPFHESQAEIDYRSACRCLEITLRVKAEEMEAALVGAGAPRLPLEHPRVRQQLKDYVLRHFSVSDAARQPVALTWVGSEVDALGAWIYLQSAAVQLPLQLRNDVLLDHEPQQVNRVLFRAGGSRQGLSFSRDTALVQWLRAADPEVPCPEPCPSPGPAK
jgi:hypothetical protein